MSLLLIFVSMVGFFEQLLYMIYNEKTTEVGIILLSIGTTILGIGMLIFGLRYWDIFPNTVKFIEITKK